MAIRVHLPSLFWQSSNTDRVETVEAEEVRGLAAALERRHPGIGERLLEPDGSLRRCVNVLVTQGGERSPAEAFAPVQDDTEVWIVPSIAGG